MPAVEVFANVPSCVASGSSGTTTSDTAWTMGTGFGSFPAASSSSSPATYFYVADPADTSHEIVQVTNTSGSSWTVTRGALGTTAVAHASGATWVQVVSHGTLQNFKQAPGASTSAVTVANTATETVVANYQPVAADIAAGVSWDVVAFGVHGVLATGARPTLTWSLYWGGSGAAGSAFTSTGSVLLAQFISGTNAPGLVTSIASGSSFDINGDVTLLSTTSATANLNWWYGNGTLSTTASNATTVNTTSGTGVSNSAAKTISGNGPIILTAKWSAASASNTLTATAPLIYRAA